MARLEFWMLGYTRMARPLTQAAVLLFGSGLCALIYQVVWLREFGGQDAN